MSEFSAVVSNSHLWKSTLASSADVSDSAERERLRSSFLSFRERAAHLATEIRRDLPDLTVHDITHLDALWEIASLIVGSAYVLTPTEGYVLGGAILLHDLAMSIAATPGAFDAITQDMRWTDLVVAQYREQLGRDPQPAERHSPSEHIRKQVLFEFLRQTHADNAEKLAFMSYKTSVATQIFVIEDTELRQTFGRIIGQIAHSHWWSIGQVEKQFSRIIGAPPWAPSYWTIDPLKLACILRAADAAHLDSRRAPTFLRAISRIGNASEIHWTFQEKLNKPYLRDDALVFTSGQSFSLPEAPAWWLCLETLKMVDRELRSIDALLSDKGLPRFAARRVAGVDVPDRLATYVQTADWLPINATVHITDLPHIIRSIGGKELYGENPHVPLRELIQNASDAIRARRLLESRTEEFGEVRVSLQQETPAWFLEVQDNGVGMSQLVLTEFLLDFGRSLWNSPQMQEEFPGLLSQGFTATGKYGIGFFSVFMTSERVKVVTRRADAAAKDTLVLEFGAGLSGRPILRPAARHEQMRDAGTIVRLQLTRDPYEEGGLLHSSRPRLKKTILDVCKQLAPALDVNMLVLQDGSYKTVVKANDWLTVAGDELLSRLSERVNDNVTANDRGRFRRRAASNLRQIKNDDGAVLGRACIGIGHADHNVRTAEPAGIVAIGGLASSIVTGICGVLLGRPTRAARDVGEPLASKAALKRWAEEQATLVPHLFGTPEERAACAQNIRICGGDTGELPIAQYRGDWVSAKQVQMMTHPNYIVFVDPFTIDFELKHVDNYVLEDYVFVTRSSGLPGLFQGSWNHHSTWMRGSTAENGLPLSLAGAVIEAIAKSWGVGVEDLRNSSDFNREDDVRIAARNGVEIKARALSIRRPR